MKESSYVALRDFVYDRTGIQLGDSKQALVMARVAQRLRALGLSDPDAYIRDVLGEENEDEIVHLLDAISTNFTSFFAKRSISNSSPDFSRNGARKDSDASGSGAPPRPPAKSRIPCP